MRYESLGELVSAPTTSFISEASLTLVCWYLMEIPCSLGNFARYFQPT